MPVHAILEVLEAYVRCPSEGSIIDRYIFQPVKMSYLGFLKDTEGYKCD